MIHRVKDFSVVNEAEVDVFLEFLCFFYDPVSVGNLVSGSSAFLELTLKKVASYPMFYQHILRQCKMCPWVRKVLLRSKGQPTPAFLPGKSKDRGVWRATILGIAKSRTKLTN